MSRVSFAPEDFYSPITGFVEVVGSPRLGEIVEAVARYHQWQPNKTTGEQQPPCTSVFLTIQPIDEQGNPVGDAVDQEVVAQWGDWARPLPPIRPGRMESRDSEPTDTAGGGALVLGAEGNALYGEDGAKLSGTSPWGVLLKSLQTCGFRADVLRGGYLPDLAGTQARFDLRPREYQTKGGVKKSATDFVAVEIVRAPYTDKPTPPTPPPAPAKAKPPGKAGTFAQGVSASPKANGAPVATPSADDSIVAVLSKVSEKNEGKILNAKQIFVWAVQLAMAEDPSNKALYDAMVATLNGKQADTWLMAHCALFNSAPAPGGGFLMVG